MSTDREYLIGRLRYTIKQYEYLHEIEDFESKLMKNYLAFMNNLHPKYKRKRKKRNNNTLVH